MFYVFLKFNDILDTRFFDVTCCQMAKFDET